MIIECPNCRSRYKYDEERFEGKPSRKIRCARCQNVFEILNPTLAEPSPPEAPQSPEGDFDSTTVRRARRPVVPDSDPAAAAKSARAPLPTTMPAGKRLSLAVLTGPAAGTVHRLDKPQMTIGRSNADINIDDTEASRQHAMVEIREGSYLLIDLGSTNGTTVDGQKITEPFDLVDKSEFQIGATILMLIVTDEL